jgi:S-adenosyl methyltransferase
MPPPGRANALVPTGLTARTHVEVTGLFTGLPLVPPGVVPLTEWRHTAGPSPRSADMYAGVARIPGARGRGPTLDRHGAS